MKRTIYTIALILLTQITFGQIKTIKVQGAGGGSVDLSGIYTKAQVDSINALNTFQKVWDNTAPGKTFIGNSLVMKSKYSGNGKISFSPDDQFSILLVSSLPNNFSISPVQLVWSNATNSTILTPGNINATKSLSLPNISGVLAASVNGVLSDATGNITIPLGSNNPDSLLNYRGTDYLRTVVATGLFYPLTGNPSGFVAINDASSSTSTTYSSSKINSLNTNLVSKTVKDTTTATKVLTSSYPLSLPNVTNPGGTGLNFLRMADNGDVYKRSQSDSRIDLGINPQYFTDSTVSGYPSKIVGSIYFDTEKNVNRLWNGKAWRNQTNVVYPDDYNFATDGENIQYAINHSVAGTIVQLSSKTYTLNRAIIINKSITLRGSDSTIITRPNADIKTLSVLADTSSTKLILDNVSGIIEGDFVVIYKIGTNDWLNTSEPIIVRGVSGDTLSIDPFNTANHNPASFPIGSKVVKSIAFIEVLDTSNVLRVPNKTVTIENIIFDGNKAGNSENFKYNLNTAVLSEAAWRATIRGCKFINAPTESVLGHNIDLLYNIFKNNNGSIFHASINKQWIADNEFMTNIIGNISDSSNLVSTTISGHSEGILTTSNSGGYVNATQNRFLNIGTDAGVIGALYPSSTYQDWGTSNYNFSGNIVNGASKLVYLIDTTTVGYLGNVYINNNALFNVGVVDYTRAFVHHPEMVINQTNGDALTVDLSTYVQREELWDSLNNKASLALVATKASLASPDFTGNPTVPSQVAGINNNYAANTYYVDRAVSTKANDNNVLHLSGGHTVTGNNTFTGNYPLVMPNLLNPGTGLDFARLGSGVLYYRTQSETRTDLGINLVDNTSDISKPVSTATQTALNLKADGSTVVHLGLNETITATKTLTSSYPLITPNLTNPAVSGLGFIRMGGDGTHYIRTQAESLGDLGAVANNAFNKNFGTTAGTVMDGGRAMDSIAALRAMLDIVDTIKTRSPIHIEVSGTTQTLVGDSATASKDGFLLATDFNTFNNKVGSVRINGTTYTPTAGLVDLGTISGGGSSPWSTISGGIQYTGGNVDVSAGNISASGDISSSSGNFKAQNTGVNLTDWYGTAFSSSRGTTWSDLGTLSTRTFYIGNANDTIGFATATSAPAARIGFASQQTQFSPTYLSSTNIPTGIFEVTNGTAGLFNIYGNGYVGIGTGTTAATEKLEVNGNVKANYFKGDGSLLTGIAASAVWGGITGTLSSQSDLNTALGLKANLASPALTGNPTAPTQTMSDNSTKVATTAFVKSVLPTPIYNVYNETTTGSTSSTLTLTLPYITSSIRLYKNGIRITSFIEATSTTITLTDVRLTTDTFIIDYNTYTNF